MNLQKHNCTEELRDADLKVTPARLGILNALEKSDMPLDVTSIITTLKKSKVKADKVTVFRIMHALTEKGLVKPIQLYEGKLRYEYAMKSEHHHFVCEQCGKIEDISDCHIGKLEKEITQKKGLLVKRHSLEFFGLCTNCQQ